MTSGSPVASASRVAVTPPSTEFSIGTMTASRSPARTAASAASTVATGVAVAVSTPGTEAQGHLGERPARPEVAVTQRRRQRSVGLRHAGRLVAGSPGRRLARAGRRTRLVAGGRRRARPRVRPARRRPRAPDRRPRGRLRRGQDPRADRQHPAAPCTSGTRTARSWPPGWTTGPARPSAARSRDAEVDDVARAATLGPLPVAQGLVAILSAGTSDGAGRRRGRADRSGARRRRSTGSTTSGSPGCTGCWPSATGSTPPTA